MRLSNRKMRLSFMAVLAAILALCLFSNSSISKGAGPQQSSQTRRPRKKIAAAPKQPRVDYAKFSHQTHVVSQKLACNSCHKVPSKNWKEVRKGDAAFPDTTDFPEHSSCLDCHRQQFFARERPAPAICSNCHIAVTPRETARWLFPSLGDLTDPKLKRREFVSEFAVGFPHDKHIDVVGLNIVPSSPLGRGLGEGLSASRKPSPPAPLPMGEGRARTAFVNVLFQEKKPTPPKSCPVCHETYQPQGNSSEEYVTKPPKNLGDNFWLKKGTFKTILNSHTVCFTCHNTDLGIPPAPGDCNLCHKLSAKQTARADFDPKLPGLMGVNDRNVLVSWSRRISAGAFRHEGGEHPDLNCMSCHNVTTFNTLDPKTMKVSVRSCGGAEGCHITATTGDGGILNYEIDQRKKDPSFVCTKCHIAFGKEGIPENHPQAIPTPRSKAKQSL